MDKYGIHAAITPTSIYIGINPDDITLTISFKLIKKKMATSVFDNVSNLKDAFIYVIPVLTEGNRENTENALCTLKEAENTKFDLLYSYNYENTTMTWDASKRCFVVKIPNYDYNKRLDIAFKSRGFKTSVWAGAADLLISAEGFETKNVLNPHLTLFKYYPVEFEYARISPSKVDVGTKYYLSWKVKGAYSCWVDGQKKVHSGSIPGIANDINQHSIFAANNTDGQAEQELCPQIGAPRIISFKSDKTHFNPGESITLSWQVASAKELIISPDIGVLHKLSGDITIKPDGSKNYLLTAKGYKGEYIEFTYQECQVIQNG